MGEPVIKVLKEIEPLKSRFLTSPTLTFSGCRPKGHPSSCKNQEISNNFYKDFKIFLFNTIPLLKLSHKTSLIALCMCVFFASSFSVVGAWVEASTWWAICWTPQMQSGNLTNVEGISQLLKGLHQLMGRIKSVDSIQYFYSFPWKRKQMQRRNKYLLKIMDLGHLKLAKVIWLHVNWVRE